MSLQFNYVFTLAINIMIFLVLYKLNSVNGPKDIEQRFQLTQDPKYIRLLLLDFFKVHSTLSEFFHQTLISTNLEVIKIPEEYHIIF